MEPAETTITGRVADQAAPHGRLAKVRNPGLELLECAAPTRADS
jgi:hypothetical protein